MTQAVADPTDESLLARAQRGDADAFGVLVDRYFGLVYTIGLARLGQPEAAQDLTQEVFLRVHLALGEFDRVRAFAPWIGAVARNLACDWLRRNQTASRLVRMVPLEEYAPELPDRRVKGADDRMQQEHENRLLDQALFDLPADQREIVLLHYMEGLRQREIARRLGLHPTQVNRRLKAALAAMRVALEPALSETTRRLKPADGAAARTMLLVGTAAALPEAARASLAAAAGGLAPLAPAALTAGAQALGCLKTLYYWWITGGIVMSGIKTASVVTAAIVLIAGGYYFMRDSGAVSRPPAAAPAVAPSPASAPSAAAGEEEQVRQTVEKFQQLYREGNLDAILAMYDIESYSRRDGSDPNAIRESLRRKLEITRPGTPTILEVIGNCRISSIQLIDVETLPDGKEKELLRGGVAQVQLESTHPGYGNEEFTLSFHKTPAGWKHVSTKQQ